MNLKRKHEVFEKFIYSPEKKTNKCKLCGVELKSIHPENLMRHLKVKHVDVYKTLDVKRRKKSEDQNNKQKTLINFVTQCKKMHSVQITPEELQNACIEMCTKNGRPLTAVEDSGFRKIIDPILKSFEKKMSINRHNIKDLINCKAEELRNSLKIKLKGKIISVKVDGAPRLDRSILGVNIQYMENGAITINTLAMLELKEKHTSEYLLSEILKVLKKFNIDVKQIYSFTSDNGANMIKTGTLLKNLLLSSSTSTSTSSTLLYEESLDLGNESDDNTCEVVVDSDTDDVGLVRL